MESHAVEAAEDAGESRSSGCRSSCAGAEAPARAARRPPARGLDENVYRRAPALGIEIHLPRYQPRSTLPLAACLWADEQGRLREFKHALYEAFFCEGEDIATDAEIARAAARAGLDPDAALAAAYAPERIARIAEIRRRPRPRASGASPRCSPRTGRATGGWAASSASPGEPLVPRRA